MAPRRNYTEAEMMRMQQDAVARVREMQDRARQAAEDANQGLPPPPATAPQSSNQGWSAGPNYQRNQPRSQNRRGSPPSSPQPPVQEAPPPEPPPPPIPPVEEIPQEDPKASTTLIGDILNAIGLDDDRLLIIGLLFILINAKADTTLILALMYLLI